MALLDSRPKDRSMAPWFRERPAWTLGVAATLFAGVFAVRLLYGGGADAISLLFILPIALLALAFGRRSGVLAGVVGVTLIVAWALLREVDLSAMGWASRVLPLLLLGFLLGDAADRLEAADARERVLVAAAQRHRDATEVNDTLVQGMAAAKWALEAGRQDAGLKTLSDTLTLGHELVSKLMREADMGPDGHRSTIRD